MTAQYLMMLALMLVEASTGASIDDDATGDFQNIYSKQGIISRERELANRLLDRLMGVAYETFKDMGGSDAELKEIQRKRGRITQCYFQAISCY